eukprot:5953266-Prymnesium_polylepis.1
MVTQGNIDTSVDTSYTYVSMLSSIQRYIAIQRYRCITTPQAFPEDGAPRGRLTGSGLSTRGEPRPDCMRRCGQRANGGACQ